MGYNAVADNTGLYLQSFSCCCLPNLRNPANSPKIRTHSAQLKVIQGHWSWCQSKAHATY